SPRDELLRLVPDDITVCVTVQNLRDHAAALASSPFVEKFRSSPLGKAIVKSEEFRQLEKLTEQFQKHFKIDPDKVRDDFLGDALALAYRAGPPGKPDQEQGLFLVRARNERALGELVEHLNKVLKDAGVLTQQEERTHKGVKYVRRVEVRRSQGKEFREEG